MHWLNILGISIALGMDAFAVAISAGLSIERLTWRHVLRLAFFFGFFQFAMAVLGWLAGTTIDVYISAFDHWVAFGLLAVIGGKMLWEAWSGKVPASRSDPTRGWTVIILSVATSIDALASARPFHSWQFDGETLKLHQVRLMMGWGYAMRLGWGTKKPTTSSVTLAVEYLPQKGNSVHTNPVAIPIGPR